MEFPVQATQFAENPYQDVWYDQDFIYSRDGIKTFPKHHCKQTFVLSQPFLRGLRNAVDIGCRDGEYSRYLQHHFAHTYCFDPRLTPHFAYNVDLSKVTHFQCALGDATGTIRMTGGQHVLVPGKITEVPCRRLDEFGLLDVDYIKIDVDGFERSVLIGGSETIERSRPIIVIEQGAIALPGETLYGAKEWLEGRGYKHVATCRRGWDHVMVPAEKLG